MTSEEKFELCMRAAKRITAQYGESLDPYHENPKNWYVTTTLILLAVVAAATSAAGAASSAVAQSNASKYNAAVAKNNATAAVQQSQFDAQQIRDKNLRILASQRAAFTANNVDPATGTASDVYQDSAIQGEMRALMAIYTGKTSATAQQAQARLDSMQAGAAKTAGIINVGSTLVGGASSIAGIATNPNF